MPPPTPQVLAGQTEPWAISQGPGGLNPAPKGPGKANSAPWGGIRARGRPSPELQREQERLQRCQHWLRAMGLMVLSAAVHE